MKKLLLVAAIASALYLGMGQKGFFHQPQEAIAPSEQVVSIGQSNEPQVSLAEQQSGSSITGTGIVTRLLPDDTDGSRHQRFILRLASGQTLLIAHNIDIAPRLDTLKQGDSVEFSGIYEANDKGGVVHWTHHDPMGRHSNGWLRHDGQAYQ